MENDQKPSNSTCMVIKPDSFKIFKTSKFLHLCYMIAIPPQLQSIPTMAFSLHNITVLVSYIVIIWFVYFMLMSYDVNKDSSKMPPTTSLPQCQVFTQFVCCFTRSTLSTLFCSEHIICQI